MRYIRGDFVGSGTGEDPYRAPDGWRHIVDLRRTDGSGGGVFVGADATPVPAGAVELQQGGLSGPALDALWAELTTGADPLGINAPRPIMPAAERVMTLWLPERESARSLSLGPGNAEWVSVLSMLRLTYLQKRIEARAGLLFRPLFDDAGRQTRTVGDTRFHRRWLSRTVAKYGIDYRLLQTRDSDLERAVLGPDLPDEPPLRSGTVLTENFNKPDSDTLGPDQTWTELEGNARVVSNTCAFDAAAFSTNRVTAALASDDHDSEIIVTRLVSNQSVRSAEIGGAARMGSSVPVTHYVAQLRSTSTINDARLDKRDVGAETNLANAARVHALPETVMTRVDGSDITQLVDDVIELGPISDSSISGNLQVGVAGFLNVNLTDLDVAGDDWLADDGVVPTDGAGQFLPPGWGGPAAFPEGTGPPGIGLAPGYGNVEASTRARQIADAICFGVTVEPSGQQGLALSLTQILYCLQGRPRPEAPQSSEASLNAIFVELGITRRRNVTLAQELDIIAAHLP